MTSGDVRRAIPEGRPAPMGPLRPTRRGQQPADHHPRRGRPHLGQQRQAVHRRTVGSVHLPGRTRPRRTRAGRRRTGPDTGVLPTLVLRHPDRHRTGRKTGRLRPGDLNRVFFTTGGGEAVESAWKLAKQYFQADRQTRKIQGDPRSIASPRHPHGRSRSPACPPSKCPSSRSPRRFPGAEHQLVPGTEATTPISRSSASGRPTGSPKPSSSRAPTRWRRCSSNWCRTPAAASPAGVLERVREICDAYDVLMVSDETICAFGRIGSMFACRISQLHPRHHHLRQGNELGYPHRRDDRIRPALRALQRRRHRLRPRLHLRRAPGVRGRRAGQSRHLRTRRPQRACEEHRAGLPATLERLHDLPIVGDVRGEGFFYGIELVGTRPPRRSSTTNSRVAVALPVHRTVPEAGLYCRADDRGDSVIQLAPL